MRLFCESWSISCAYSRVLHQTAIQRRELARRLLQQFAKLGRKCATRNFFFDICVKMVELYLCILRITTWKNSKST